MRRVLFAAVLSALTSATLPSPAQDWAQANLARSPRHGEFVTIDEPGGRKLQAWVVYPEIKEKAPVVIMIHEIFGLSDWAREMADELAGAGYIVVEPDLLSGLGPASATAMHHPAHRPSPNSDASPKSPSSPDPLRSVTGKCDPMACPPKSGAAHFVAVSAPQQPADHAHMQMPPAGSGAPYAPASPGGTSAFQDQGSITRAVSSLPDPQVLADLDAAADFGKKLPAASGKLFVAGFCWGGGKSFLFATHRKDLGGAFVFYGPPPAANLMAAISAPVYGFYAANDARISSTVPQTQEQMKAAGKTYDPVTYDGAGHGFMRAGEAPDANAANTAARQQAFRRLVKLLGGVH